jgi:hypothetical protein
MAKRIVIPAYAGRHMDVPGFEERGKLGSSDLQIVKGTGSQLSLG